ncbi:MAG: hypothetical protein ACXACH_07895 [Candidatus Hermodarchaeia archaeon]|jgi:hypothetical protein
MHFYSKAWVVGIVIIITIGSVVGWFLLFNQKPLVLSIHYTAFNLSTPTIYTLSQSQFSPWETEVVNQLIYNASNIHQATIRFTNSSSTDYLYVVMYMDGSLQIALNTITLFNASHSWHPNYILRVTITSNTCSITNGTHTVVSAYSLPNWITTHISGFGGGDNEHVALAGQIHCIVNGDPSTRQSLNDAVDLTC